MLTYHPIDTSPTEEWLDLLNSDQVRRHLIQHPRFTHKSLKRWLQDKIQIDQESGCILRAIRSDGRLVGWCGVQLEAGEYELALVLSPDYWGHGREIMKEIIVWARALGHRQLLAHFLITRPQTTALTRLFGPPVRVSKIHDNFFNTYQIDI